MAERALYEAKEGFNTVFNIIENCEIEVPAFDNGFTSGKFFFKKRNGITETNDMGGEETKRIAIYEDPTKRVNLAITNAHLKSFSLSGTSDIASVNTDTVLSQSDIYVPGGTVERSSTVTSAANASGGDAAYIDDTTASFMVNALVGKYIWISSGTGAGQIRTIKSNTATRIYIDEGWINTVAPASGSGYRVYPFLAQTGLISSQSGAYVKFFDGTNVQTITTLEPFIIAEEFEGRMWYVKYSNQNIIFYTEIGQPFLIAGFIDTGLDNIICARGFGEYLLIGKKNKIRAIRNDLMSDNTTVYNIKDLITGTGVKSDRAIDIWKGQAYFVGSDNRIYTLGINASSSNDLTGEIEDISNIFGGYIDNYDFDYAIFLKKPQELHVILNEEQGNTSRVFKYYNKYKGWMVDTFSFVLSDAKYLGDTYYYSTSDKICIGSGDKDLDETFYQRVGVLHGVADIFPYKRITHINYVMKYVEKETAKVVVQTNGNSLRASTQNNIDDSTLANAGILSTTPRLGENILESAPLGGEFDTSLSYSDVRIFSSRVLSAGNFFQIIFNDEHGNGFHLGDVAIIYTSLNPKINGRDFGK